MMTSHRYAPVHHIVKNIFGILVAVATINSQAAITPPKKDIHFLAEHLAESAQEARFFSLPWPDGDYSKQNWRPLVSIAGARTSDEFAAVNGQLLLLGVSKNRAQHWGAELLFFYDRFHVGGDSLNNALTANGLNSVPLDLPAHAIFSNPDGEFTSSGGALLFSHALGNNNTTWTWDILGGVVIQHLQLENFTFNYELTDGIDAGASGVLDHSGNSDFVYYLIGVQAKRIVADHYTIIPRFVYGRPSTHDNFYTRLTGPGFELTNASTGSEPGSIGDQFGYIGMTVRDNTNNFEMDVGAIAGYAFFELTAHEGIETAVIVSLTWRM
jgi:hypothetical protein